MPVPERNGVDDVNEVPGGGVGAPDDAADAALGGAHQVLCIDLGGDEDGARRAGALDVAQLDTWVVVHGICDEDKDAGVAVLVAEKTHFGPRPQLGHDTCPGERIGGPNADRDRLGVRRDRQLRQVRFIAHAVIVAAESPRNSFTSERVQPYMPIQAAMFRSGSGA
ncbi:hypothetical protein ACIA9I_36425 [Streptomyces anulatus]